MIYDMFSFYNEMELLDVRLHELYDVVDQFVLLEATHTYTGKPKPLYYTENSSSVYDPKHKITRVVVYDTPLMHDACQAAITEADRKWLGSTYQLGDNWVRERFQRDQLMFFILTLNPDDIIIYSDADEIVKASVVRKLEETLCDGSNAVEQRLNSYYFNVRCTNMPWWGSKIIRKKFMPSSVSELRFHTPASCFIKNGGWHFNFFGGVEKIQQKIKAYAHSEFDNPDILSPENIKFRLDNHLDVLGRLYEYEVIPSDKYDLPEYVMSNKDKFEGFFYK